MKSIAKVLLVGAVAMMTIAVSAAPSEAKKRTKAGTFVGQVCSAGCGKNNVCKVNMWTANKKWVAATFPTCLKPACPASC